MSSLTLFHQQEGLNNTEDLQNALFELNLTLPANASVEDDEPIKQVKKKKKKEKKRKLQVANSTTGGQIQWNTIQTSDITVEDMVRQFNFYYPTIVYKRRNLTQADIMGDLNIYA